METKEVRYACISLRDYDGLQIGENIFIRVWKHKGSTRLFIQVPEQERIIRHKRDTLPVLNKEVTKP